MSWLKAAINRAAEAAGAGSKTIGPNLGRARFFAGSVVQTAGSAVAGGARAVLERASLKHYNNFKHAVKRLDEVSLNARGEERTQALARWLGALKELDRDAKASHDRVERQNSGREENSTPSGSSSPRSQRSEDELSQQPSKVALVLFYDPEISSEPLTFRDVFLRSHALENITKSLIIDPPQDEEVNLLLEMFGLTLSGGPELHNAIVSGIQDLAKAYANVSQLVLDREDLLQMAADAITGLKLQAEIERMEAEAVAIEAQLAEKIGLVTLKDSPGPRVEPVSEGNQGILSDVSVEVRDGASVSEELLHYCARLVEIAKQKEALIQQGDTTEVRQTKVEKMKQLAEELAKKAKGYKEKVTESRQQKSDAMAYRVTKSQEVTEAEKIISQEMQVLQKRREELEAELKQVMEAIAAQTRKHIHIQEEKEQFDEASSNIVAHLALQEDELGRLIQQHSAEASVAGTWRSFLEDTWLLQTSCMETMEKAAKETVKEIGTHFWSVAVGHLVYRQEELDALLIRLKMYNEELSTIRAKKADLEKKGMDGVVADITSGRKKIEQKYLEVEGQVKNVLVAVEKAKAELQVGIDLLRPGDDVPEKKKVDELLASLEVRRKDFDAMKRPKLDIENPATRSKKSGTKSSESWGRGPPGMARSMSPHVPVSSDEAAAGHAVASPAQSGAGPAESGAPQVEAGDKKAEEGPDSTKSDEKVQNGDTSKGEDKNANDDGDKSNTDGWEFDDLEEDAKETHRADSLANRMATPTDTDGDGFVEAAVSEGLNQEEELPPGGLGPSGPLLFHRSRLSQLQTGSDR